MRSESAAMPGGELEGFAKGRDGTSDVVVEEDDARAVIELEAYLELVVDNVPLDVLNKRPVRIESTSFVRVTCTDARAHKSLTLAASLIWRWVTTEEVASELSGDDEAPTGVGGIERFAGVGEGGKAVDGDGAFETEDDVGFVVKGTVDGVEMDALS